MGELWKMLRAWAGARRRGGELGPPASRDPLPRPPSTWESECVSAPKSAAHHRSDRVRRRVEHRHAVSANAIDEGLPRAGSGDLERRAVCDGP